MASVGNEGSSSALLGMVLGAGSAVVMVAVAVAIESGLGQVAKKCFPEASVPVSSMSAPADHDAASRSAMGRLLGVVDARVVR